MTRDTLLSYKLDLSNSMNNENAITQMESSADTYEQTLNLENNNYDMMEALADVYELISKLESKINDIETQLKGGK